MKNGELKKKNRVEEPLEPTQDEERPSSGGLTGPGEPTHGKPPADGGGDRPVEPSKPSLWRRVPLLLLIAAFVIVLIWVIWQGLRGEGAGPTVSVRCIERPALEARAAGEPLPMTRFLVEDEVIVIGPTTEVSAVVGSVRGPAPDQPVLEPVRECELGNLSGLARSPGLDADDFPFPSRLGEKLAMNLYRVAAGRSAAEVVAEINALGQAQYVYADANYLTGMLGQGQCSNPYEPVGSPYEPVGSPYEPVGSPLGGNVEAVRDLFWEQWAFEHVGAGGALDEVYEAAASVPGGAGVTVGVFDTLPFTLTPGEELVGDGYVVQTDAESVDRVVQASAAFSWMTPTLELLMVQPDMPVLTPTVTNPFTVSEHGLFVAGLIHAVAPESDIQLVRVLNEYGCGDLYTLNLALYRFIEQVQAGEGEPGRSLINLSLGVNKPMRSEVEEPASGDRADDVVAEIEAGQATYLITDTIESLRAATALAESSGIVVVAAAGNDSFRDGVPLPPHIPARYPMVVGVGASNLQRERSCFSNWGDVYAPGGESLSIEPDRLSDGSCGPRDYEPQENGSEAVISLMWSSETHYGYWRGTSFATPLVSGLAALVLDAGVPGEVSEVPRRVFDAVRCGAPRGDGVINVPATLLRCLP